MKERPKNFLPELDSNPDLSDVRVRVDRLEVFRSRVTMTVNSEIKDGGCLNDVLIFSSTRQTMVKITPLRSTFNSD